MILPNPKRITTDEAPDESQALHLLIMARGGRGRRTEPNTGPSHPEGRLGHLSYI